MSRPERTVVCGNPATVPPPLSMLTEAEPLMTFLASSQCVGRPPAVPNNGERDAIR
jgi:hypothetical protein